MNFLAELWVIAQPLVIYLIIALVIVVLIFLAGFLLALLQSKWAQFKTKYPQVAWAMEEGARMAVRAVEQMANAGGINPADKLAEAMHITGQYIDSAIPGATVNEEVLRAAIEAAVYVMKENQDSQALHTAE